MRLIKQSLVGLALLGLVVGPLSASAFSYGKTSTQPTTVNFCTRITSTASDINSKLTKAEDNRGNVRLDILGKLKDRRTQRAQDINKLRDDATNKFEDLITRLEGKATTDPEKAAVATFKTTVETAMTTRKTAVDAAFATYETALASLVGSREDAIKTAAATFKTAVALAITTAQTSCAATGAVPETIRTAFMASLKSANDAFRQAVQVKVNGTIQQQIEALVKTRAAAVQAANQTFRDAVKAAATALKTALGTATP